MLQHWYNNNSSISKDISYTQDSLLVSDPAAD